MSDSWLPTLITMDAESGYALAITLSRVAVKMTQPDADIRTKLRHAYENDFEALISTSGVVAIHFQTVAKANNYWRE
jgi:hypothetical protein